MHACIHDTTLHHLTRRNISDITLHYGTQHSITPPDITTNYIATHCRYARTHIHTYIHTYMCIYIYICICMCIYIYICTGRLARRPKSLCAKSLGVFFSPEYGEFLKTRFLKTRSVFVSFLTGRACPGPGFFGACRPSF